MFQQVLQAIKDYNRIIIHRHSFPDGDAIGSQVGLANIIKDNFPEKQVFMVGDPAIRYSFVEGSTMDVIPDEYYENSLAFILDCGASKLINDERYKLADKTIRFDHHLYVESIADVDVVDSTYESCCGLIAMFAKEMGLKLSKISATALFTGMVTDSGRFVFDSTTARTFELAAFLMSQPIDTATLYYNLYAEDFADIIKKADNKHKIKFTENNVAYIYTDAEELKKSGETATVNSRVMIGNMKDIKNVFIWASFAEGDDGVHVELRSNRYNINPIAVKYGGGGHKKASGCMVKDYNEAMLLLADLDKIVTCSE